VTSVVVPSTAPSVATRENLIGSILQPSADSDQDNETEVGVKNHSDQQRGHPVILVLPRSDARRSTTAWRNRTAHARRRSARRKSCAFRGLSPDCAD
jgi:hypothetical protein